MSTHPPRDCPSCGAVVHVEDSRCPSCGMWAAWSMAWEPPARRGVVRYLRGQDVVVVALVLIVALAIVLAVARRDVILWRAHP